MQMKTETLKQLIKTVRPAIARTMLPVTNYCLIEADGSTIKATATDLKTTIVSAADCESDTLRVLLPAARMSAILDAMTGEDITVETDGESNVISIDCGASEFKIFAPDPESFPLTPTFDAENQFAVPTGKWRNVIGTVQHAVCKDSCRPMLCGVRTIVNGQTLTAVSTDGKRLAVAHGDVIQPNKAAFTLQPKAAAESCKLPGDTVRVSFDESHVRISCDDDSAQIISSLVAGSYPDYKQVVPKKHTVTVRLGNVDDFAIAVKRAALLVTEKSCLSLYVAGEGVKMSAETKDVGQYEELYQTEIDGSGGISLNPAYLLDALGQCGPLAILRWKDESSPLLVESSGNQFVIMPVRA